MRKSFTRLLSLVMCLLLFSYISMASVEGIDAKAVWPKDDGAAKAYTKTTDKILVIYSEAVTAGTGSVRVLDAANNVLGVLPGNDSRISYAKGDTVAIDLSATLKELTAYTVNIDAGAFKTVKDGTVSLAENFVFTTGDYTAPKLKAVEPEKGTVLETKTGNNLKVTFSDLSIVSKGKGTVAVYKADGNLWDLIDVATRGSVAEVDGDYVLTLTNVRTLEDNTSYAVTLSSGIVEDEGLTSDESKNVYGGLTDRTVWTFSTVDFSAPTYATGYPKKSNVGNDSFDVLVKTNEAGTAYGVVLAADADAPTAAEIRGDANVVDIDVVGGTEATLSFDGLEEATDYIAYVVVDNDDINGTVVKSVAVTTSETDAPMLVSVKYDYTTSTDETSGVAHPVSGDIVDENTSVEKDLKTVVLTFNEEVKLGVGSIIIKKVLDNSVFKTINSADMTLSDDKMSVKFSLSGLGNNVKYYAVIPGTLVLDVYDNKYAGISTVTGWRFNSSDDIAPTYTVVPAHAATNVKKDAKVVITFDEVVSASADDFDLSYDSEDVSIDFSYSQNDNDGKYTVITLTPTSELPSGQLVQLLVYEGSISDLAGNFVGLEVDETKAYSFFVEDHAGPTIKSWTATPLTSETATVKITYNEGIRLLGGTEITSANLPYILTVKKTDASGSNVAVNYAIDDAKKVISITPVTKWESEGTYYFAVSSDVEDLSGNAFAGDDIDRSKTYTVNDLVAETVAIDVADKTISTDLTVNPITVKFNEATPAPSHTEARAEFSVAGNWVALTDVAQMNQVIVLKEGSATGPNVPFSVGGTNGNFTVTASLEGNKTYYIGVGPSTKDAAGNVNVEKFVTFKTKFEDAPELVSVAPADGATQVAKTSNFVLTFNTGVKLSSTYATGDVYFSLDNGATSVKNIASTEISFNTDGTVVTINPANDTDLATDKVYDLIVGSGVFQNKNTPNVAFGGIAANDWDFATTDTQIEVATLSNDEATDVAIDDDFVLTFNEKIGVGSGNIDIKNFNTDAVVERIAVGSSNVTIDAADDLTTITINPTNLLKYNTKYYIEVDAGAFKDVAGNSSKEIYGKTTARGVYDWVVTTANVDLAITKVTPANGSDKISSTSSIVVEFNRDIKGGAGQIGYIEQNNETGVTQDQKFAIGSSNLSFSGNKLTIIHPEKVFPANTKIWLYIGAGAVAVSTEDANVIGEVSNTTEDTWSFNTGDVNAPKPTFDPVAFVDEDGKRVYVSVNKAITVSFDEDIFHKVDGTVFTSGDITDDNVFQLFKGATEVTFVGSISGRTVTMTPDLALDEFTEYTIKINNGVDGVMDNKNHVTPYTEVKFRTTDLTAPTISLTATGADKKVVLSGISVTDPNAAKFYYLVRAKSVSAAPSVAEIKAANNVKVADLGSDIEVKDLAASTTYEVFYVADDTFGNTSTVAKKEASTTDTVAPLLTSTDPANNAVDVNVTDAGTVVIKLNFNENVVKGTGAIVLREQVTQTVFATYDAASVLAAGADNKKLVLTLNGISTVADAKKFYVEMAQGSVVDGAANPFAGLFGTNGIFFTTEDNSKPTFTHDDTDGIVATNENIKIKFSEGVKAGTGTAILYKGSVATANAVQVFNASDVTFSGTSVTVNPTADLLNNQTYVLVVNAGFALDLSSNKNANALGQFTFVVSENVAPYVVSIADPGEDDSYNKDDLEYFDFDFSEDLYFEIDGISLSRLYLTDAQIKANGILSVVDEKGVAVPYEMYQCCSNDFTFYLDTDLLGHNKKYTVTIKGLTDVDGLEMTPYSHTFVTTDGVRPVAVFNPADEAENVIESGKLTMTFNEQIYHSVSIIDGDNFYYEPFTNTNVDNVVYLQVNNGEGWDDVDFDATFNGTNTITITPAEALVSGAEYRYGFMSAGVVDGDDQVTDGDDVAYFTVRDYTVPTFDIANVSPAKKATGVLANAKMSVIFSEPIVVSTGKVIIRNLDGTIFQAIDATGLSVDADNSAKLNIAHNNFAVKAEYFVELEKSVVTDKSGNPNKAYSDAVNGWLFTTKDTYSIEAVVTPTGDNNQRVVNLEMNFNKNVQPNADGDFGHFLTVYKEDGTAVKQIDATDLVVLNKKVTFFNLELDANQRYYARVEPGAFVDESDNSFAGIMDNSWTFSTIDNIAPKVVTLSPADDSKAVDTQTSSLVMTFDRNIALGTGTIAVRYAVDGALFEEVSVANAVVNASAKSLTVNLTKTLDSNTAFYVIVPAGAVTNTESTKDAFAGILNTYTWNFTTSTDQTAPKLVTWTPNATTTTDNDPTYVLTFDENVVLGAGNLKIYKKADNTLALTIPVTATMVNGKVVTVKNTYNATSNNGLDKNTDYYVLVDGGLVKDAAGNASAAVTDVAAWTFKTGADFATVIDTPIDNSLAFKVYPNPFVDDVTVETSFDLTKVVVTNIAGQVVKQVVNPAGTIQLNELRSGVYFMALYQGGKVAATVKIVKR